MPHPLPIAVSPEIHDKLSACIHCGLCLPACPTYVLSGDEAESPRGRIYLMKAAVDARVQPSDSLFNHLDSCLACRACEPACPSGVHYHDILEAVRPQIAAAVLSPASASDGGGPLSSSTTPHKTMRNPLLAWLVTHILPFPRRVALTTIPLKIARALGLSRLIAATEKILPAPLGSMSAMLPPTPLFEKSPPTFTPAIAPRRGTVVLLQGCVGSVVSKSLNRDCAFVLARNGFDVHLLANEPCCGAMAAHANDPQSAQKFARQLVALLASRGNDYFVSPIAGCGAQLKSLHHVLADDRDSSAASVVAKMRDITELLAEVGLHPPRASITRTVTYHDPCHLLNAQKIALAPRALLQQIPGLSLVPLPETDLCCGAAGTYNLSQPVYAQQLGDRKARNICRTGAAEILTANVGCQLHIQRSLNRTDKPVPVRHVIELLAEAYRAESST